MLTLRKFFKSVEFRLVLVAIVSIAVFLMLYRHIYPETSLKIPVSKDEIQLRAETFLASLNYDVHPYSCRIRLNHDEDLLRYLQISFGSREALRTMSDSLHVFHWECEWEVGKDVSDTIAIVMSSEDGIDIRQHEMSLSMTPEGRPYAFSMQNPSDSIFTQDADLSLRTAARLFEEIVPDTSGWKYQGIHAQTDTKQHYYQVQYTRHHSVAGLEQQYTIDVSDTRILGFAHKWVTPPKTKEQESMEHIIDIASFLSIYMLFIVLGLIFLIKRLRSDQVDLVSGLLPGILIVFSWTIIFLYTETQDSLGASLLGYFIATPFVVGAIWTLFVLGESFSREVWPEKLRIADQLRKKIISSRLGLALIRGTLLGTAYLALDSVMSYLMVNTGGGFIPLAHSHLLLWSVSSPFLLSLGRSIMSALFLVIPLCMFFLSLLKRYVKNKALFFFIIALVWMMICPPVHDCAPILQRIPMNLLMGIVLLAVFLRFELCTSFITVAVASLIYNAVIFVHSHHTYYELQGLLLLCVPVILIILGIWLVLRRKKLEDAPVYVPDYMKRIYHREQLQRELEIARDVQMTFLPQEDPHISGLDVVSMCIPAREVGGDYFDYVRLDDQRFGVAIGDVSGKGIPAAIYMTLTKGLFQSLATSHDSPREVLIRLNQLFFRNARRDIFISMIYSVFDMKRKTMTFARAGHNPMILHRGSEKLTEELCPPGIAIGFEQDHLFNSTIQEHTLSLKANDLFLFYTDGLNEAQNMAKQEFGDKRLLQVLSEGGGLPVQQLLANIKNAIFGFTGDAEQYDDMTAVLIKVKP